MDTADYCRAIETYLCRKNDGHLIRIVGPSFDLVSGWAEEGIPLKIACAGIDRHFARRARDPRPRRRPVRIDFCDDDVRDAFDEWRRVVLATSAPADDAANDGGGAAAKDARRVPGSATSLPAHLERVLLRLSQMRARGALDAGFDELIDRVARDLDTARASSGGVRGESRRLLIERLAAIDRELLDAAHASLDASARTALAGEADDELSAYRARMTADAYSRAHGAMMDRLVRERFGLPTVSWP